MNNKERLLRRIEEGKKNNVNIIRIMDMSHEEVIDALEWLPSVYKYAVDPISGYPMIRWAEKEEK